MCVCRTTCPSEHMTASNVALRFLLSGPAERAGSASQRSRRQHCPAATQCSTGRCLWCSGSPAPCGPAAAAACVSVSSCGSPCPDPGTSCSCRGTWSGGSTPGGHARLVSCDFYGSYWIGSTMLVKFPVNTTFCPLHGVTQCLSFRRSRHGVRCIPAPGRKRRIVLLRCLPPRIRTPRPPAAHTQGCPLRAAPLAEAAAELVAGSRCCTRGHRQPGRGEHRHGRQRGSGRDAAAVQGTGGAGGAGGDPGHAAGRPAAEVHRQVRGTAHGPGSGGWGNPLFKLRSPGSLAWHPEDTHSWLYGSYPGSYHNALDLIGFMSHAVIVSAL